MIEGILGKEGGGETHPKLLKLREILTDFLSDVKN
jgi:hypothetical protein